MAQRPIFLTDNHGAGIVKEMPLSIQWHSGFSKKQKQKNVEELHKAALRYVDGVVPLEISTKSSEDLGVKLSAFNLPITLPDGQRTSVECAYQGSKVFERGGAFKDLYFVRPWEAKKDGRLHESGDIIHFDYFGTVWALEPKTAFYDWLYITALKQSDFGDDLLAYSAFSDIEFNPNKSLNCQARAAAMFVALMRRDGDVDLAKDKFLHYYDDAASETAQIPMAL